MLERVIIGIFKLLPNVLKNKFNFVFLKKIFKIKLYAKFKYKKFKYKKIV